MQQWLELLRTDLEATDHELASAGADRNALLKDLRVRMQEYFQEMRRETVEGAVAVEVSISELLEYVDAGDLKAIEKRLFYRSQPLEVRRPRGVKRAVRWLWKGWLPMGKVTLLAGQGGVGKGTLMSYLVACATGCRPWPDGTRSPNGQALVVSTDDDEEDTLWPRLELSGVKADRVMLPTTGGIPDWNALAERCRLIEDLRLVYIDVMQAGMASGKDGNSAVDVAEHMGRFAEIAKGAGAAVIVVHHTNKRTASRIKEGDLSDLVRGSGAWTDAARMAWLYCRDDQDKVGKSRLLTRIKCNLPVDWLDGAWRISSHTKNYLDDDGLEGEVYVVHRIEAVEGSADDIINEAVGKRSSGGEGDSPADRRRAEVLQMLSGGPELQSTVEAGLQDGGCSRSTANNTVKRMIMDRDIVQRKAEPGEFPGKGSAGLVLETAK